MLRSLCANHSGRYVLKLASRGWQQEDLDRGVHLIFGNPSRSRKVHHPKGSLGTKALIAQPYQSKLSNHLRNTRHWPRCQLPATQIEPG